MQVQRKRTFLFPQFYNAFYENHLLNKLCLFVAFNVCPIIHYIKTAIYQYINLTRVLCMSSSIYFILSTICQQLDIIILCFLPVLF